MRFITFKNLMLFKIQKIAKHFNHSPSLCCLYVPVKERLALARAHCHVAAVGGEPHGRWHLEVHIRHVRVVGEHRPASRVYLYRRRNEPVRRLGNAMGLL